jgi:hypothetical protein
MLENIIEKKDGEGRRQRIPYLEAPADATWSREDGRLERRRPPAARGRTYAEDPAVVQDIRLKAAQIFNGARTGHGDATSMTALPSSFATGRPGSTCGWNQGPEGKVGGRGPRREKRPGGKEAYTRRAAPPARATISVRNPGRNLWYHNKSDLKSSTRAPKIPP